MIPEESLLEKISGRYADGSALESVPPANRCLKSINEHLWRLFNTRQGSVPHLPDYGLPDITEIYRKLPGSLETLEEEVFRLVNKYEPRLERVRVSQLKLPPTEFRIAFELTGHVRGGPRVSFKTSFASTGEIAISHKKKAS